MPLSNGGDIELLLIQYMVRIRKWNRHFKRHFTSTPIPIQLNPCQQFIVEVDASHSSVKMVLSKKSELNQKPNSCTFFSCHLTSFITLAAGSY